MTKGFNPWPVGIIAFLIAGALFLAGFIVYSTFHRVDLVAPDYYAQELRYQEQMNRRDRAGELSGKVAVLYDAPQHRLSVRIPLEHAGRQPTGTIHLYRPSAAGQDRKLPLEVQADGAQTFDARDLASGLWRVRITWQVGGQEYFGEEQVIIGSGVLHDPAKLHVFADGRFVLGAFSKKHNLDSLINDLTKEGVSTQQIISIETESGTSRKMIESIVGELRNKGYQKIKIED